MKKLLSIFLILILTTALLGGSASAAEATLVAATIKADSAYTTATRTTDAKIVAALKNLVDISSSAASVKEADTTFLASVTFESEPAASYTYNIYKDKSGKLYAKFSTGSLRRINAESFYKLADQTGIGFYRYRPIPTATVSGDKLIAVQSSYNFKKLDGKFYKTQLATPDELLVNGNLTALPTPSFSATPASVKVSATPRDAQAPEWSGALADISKFSPKTKGDYRIRYTATYNTAHYKGDVTYEINVDTAKFKAGSTSAGSGATTTSNTGPSSSTTPSASTGVGGQRTAADPKTGVSFAIEWAGKYLYQGEFIIVRAKDVPYGTKVSAATTLPFGPNFFRESNGDAIALIPVASSTTPGGYSITVTAGSLSQKFTFTVYEKKFPVQNLTVPAATAEETILSQKANDQYEQYIKPVRPVCDGLQYWNGKFVWPLKGERRVTTQFGTIRYTNGGTTPSRHGAIDLAAPAGTPVYAPAKGRVLFAGFLQLTGYTIVIEHGYGLKTWYYHMNSINVETDDMLKQDQQIGKVGSTGFSTGAHLHFGMSINNTFVNPETMIHNNLFGEK